MNKKLGHDAIYDARELGVPRMLLLGLQHLFAMFGATVLVPILVTGYGLPLSIQTTLLFAGIGTLLFHVCTKFKVPAFLGSSFAFLGGFQAVANLDSGKFAAMTGEEKLPYALGGVVLVCAAVQLVRYFAVERGIFQSQLTLISGIICLGLGAFLILRSAVSYTHLTLPTNSRV